MMAFVLAAAVLVGALFIATVLDGARTTAPSGIIAPRVRTSSLVCADEEHSTALWIRLCTLNPTCCLLLP
jgi:hypothetical protein